MVKHLLVKGLLVKSLFYRRLFSRNVLPMGLLVLAPVALAQPMVATTIKPVTMIVQAIAGEHAQVEQILSNNASPHDFALRPSDVRKLYAADTVVWVGESLEAFMEKPLKNAGKLQGSIEWLALEGLTTRSHSDEHEEGHDEEGHDDEHEKQEESAGHDEHEHDGVDAHVWLNPDNAIVLAQAVTQRLSQLDPEHSGDYQANLAWFMADVSNASIHLGQELSLLKDFNYVVFHDAYGYFEDYFGMQHVAALALSPERKPGAKKVLAIRQLIEDKQVDCVLSEPQFSPAIVEVLLEGSQVKTAVIDPLGVSVPLTANAYSQFLKQLTQQIKACL